MEWFWADPHLDHGAIINYCDRPFKMVKEMNRALIKNYQDRVSPDDTVYFLGDLSMRGPENFGYYRKLLSKTLPGRKILILGNHDRLNPFAYVEAGFESVHTSLVIYDWDNNEYVLCHDPAPACGDRRKKPDKSRIWICGHVHSLFKTCGNVINVGVDVWDYRPVDFNEIHDLHKELKLNLWEEWKCH